MGCWLVLIIENTPNYTGVSISGTFDDLYNLVEAFHEITIDEFTEKYPQYIGVSIRVLGVCYDVRHAYQGDREIKLVDNNMSEEKMRWHSIITPTMNVKYSCNILYPEMFYVILILNELINIRINELTKGKYKDCSINDRRVIWDETIVTIRNFQAAFNSCVRNTLTPASYSRWLNLMSNENISVVDIAHQYIDLLNSRFMDMTKEKRRKSLSLIAKRIAEYHFNDEHNELKAVVESAALDYGCTPEEIAIDGIEYPDVIEW